VVGAVASIAAVACTNQSQTRNVPDRSDPSPTDDEMPMRVLGQTGEKVSLIGLGGFHIGSPTDDAEGIRIIRTAIDRGVTFLDNCWD
jgi:uncharacterized protein